jgi:monoamine oxidase
MIRFPRTHRPRPLSRADRPERMMDLRFQRPECREKLKGIRHVAVVGGGLAGLMAARRLVQHGVKVTLFEARKEVGGRVLSNPDFAAGRITEEGAELIGSFHTKWLELAREFGLAMISRMDSDLYELECLDVKLTLDKDLKMHEFKKLTGAMNERVLRPLADLAMKEIKDPSKPWQEDKLRIYDNMSVQDALPKFCQISERKKNPDDERLWKMLEFKLVNDEVAPLDQMNFLGLLCKVRAGQGERCVEGEEERSFKDEYWDELEIFRCADGCQTLAKRIAEKIQTKQYGPEPAKLLRLRAVTQINLSGDLSEKGVTVSVKKTRPNGEFADDTPPFPISGFSYVILAIPPSVWPRVKIWADDKDADPAKEIGQMRMNDAVKFFSKVKERFWIKEKPAPNRDRGSAPYGGSLRIGQVWEGADNQTRVGKQEIVLSVFAGPVSAGRVPTEDDFNKELTRLYRGYAGNVTKRRFTNWPKVPFIRTGYWAPYPGEIFRVGQKLTKPYHDRLFFAGEHTQMDFFGYMEGALRSGERAAETLMLSACGLLEKTAPKSPSPPPQRPTPKPPSPLILALAAPTREYTAFGREVGSRLDERSTTDYPGEAESPFLDRNLFAAGVEEEWEPRLAALVAESPFASALEERRSRFDEDQSDEEETPDELEDGEELEAAEVWEDMEEDQLTSPADQAEDEFLGDENAERYASPATEWSPGPTAEEAEDFTGADYGEDELELLHEQPLEERFDPSAVPPDVADALGRKDWPLALKLAIEAGSRDENELTNLIFFARHPELPSEKLDPKDPNFEQLSSEWSRILDREVWRAIQASAENTDFVVSGAEVTDHHRRFFRGKSGKRLKTLVEDAAREVDLNPGLLGTIMMAETRRPQSYLLSEKVSSYHIGADDFYEGRAAIQARVPAYAKVKWDKKQKPSEHLNDAKTNRRVVKTILFDSGPDAVLATAVYVKFREVRLREIAAELEGDFDSLPLATRMALTRMAMAAGTAGATRFLKDALKGRDIFVRKAIPVAAYQTQRNATVRTAQAIHLSDWVFGIPVPAAAAQPELEAFGNSDDAGFADEAGFPSADEFEEEAGDHSFGEPEDEWIGAADEEVAPWAAGIDPFPTKQTVTFDINDDRMIRAFAPVTVSTAMPVCTALVDLTGNPAMPPYAGVYDKEMIFSGSLPKICVMYAAFALRSRVQAFVDAAAANGAPVVPPGITAEIKKAWKPKLRALFPTRPGTSFGNGQDITFPKLDQILTFSPDGKVDFKRATPSLTNPQIDAIGEFGAAQGMFHEWLRSMLRWSNNTAASKCILVLGYFYLNGALARAGLFDAATSEGLWLSADFKNHDWVKTDAQRKANAAGPQLTPRWATAQRRRRSNVTATAAQVARFMTLLAQNKLVDATASHPDPNHEMRALMRADAGGLGSDANDALRRVGRDPTLVIAKFGKGNDDFRHECAIIERTVGDKHLRYVAVGLGYSPKRRLQNWFDLFILLDEVIVTRNK